QIDPALQLHSGSVQIQHPSFNADSFFDVFFTLDLVAADASPSAPVVKITTTGQYLSAPLSVQTASWGEVKSFYRKEAYPEKRATRKGRRRVPPARGFFAWNRGRKE